MSLKQGGPLPITQRDHGGCETFPKPLVSSEALRHSRYELLDRRSVVGALEKAVSAIVAGVPRVDLDRPESRVCAWPPLQRRPGEADVARRLSC